MGRPVIDITSQKFGLLTPLYLMDEDYIDKRGCASKQWMCQCDCGNRVVAIGTRLKMGQKKSCGCLGRLKSLTNSQIGKLSIGEMFYKKGKTPYYHCRCECGNNVDVCHYDLISKKRVSCGCDRSKERPNRVKDITGKRVGRLTVIERDTNEYYTKGGNRIYKWICQCDCGRLTSVNASAIRSGSTKSCGCLYLERAKKSSLDRYEQVLKKRKESSGLLNDLTGQTFGLLTVIRRDLNNKNRVAWICQCECGNQTTVVSNNLTNGHTQSCGCINSVGEMKIQKILDSKKIDYIKWWRNDNCKDNRPLPFDFAIKMNGSVVGVIEYDGQQHFRVCRFNGMTWEDAEKGFKTCLKHDEIKNAFCLNNGIELLRIKYTEIESIEDIITSFIFKLKERENVVAVC